MVPLWRRLFSDQLTPVELFRTLVPEDDTTTHAFLLESVTNDGNVSRFSFVGARPVVEVIAKRSELTQRDYRSGALSVDERICDDPWRYIAELMRELPCADVPELPASAFTGGWVGYGGYDTFRYAESTKLPFNAAPPDDRGIPDMHMGLYQSAVVFDHFAKMVYVIEWVDLHDGVSRDGSGPPRSAELSDAQIAKAYESGMHRLETLVARVMEHRLSSPLPVGFVDMDTAAASGEGAAARVSSNMSKDDFLRGIEKCKHHIVLGDAFQIVLSQRFEVLSDAHPFNVYRALRVINPSPYMIYLQCDGCVLVASSPEILCRVRDGVMVNRPLAGTRWRGRTEAEDAKLAEELLKDEKEIAEHIMLVDLGRNDVGRVAQFGTVNVEKLMEIERYSHVMHISSTVTGRLRGECTSWDALRSALPAGTVSGAPKIRAMQILDTIEPHMRGPYGGGIGFVSFADDMNIALALRTMVIQRAAPEAACDWRYYLQAGAGIVADSDPEAEYQETINKSMAMVRAVDLAEQAFSS